ncbi:hypothetical protein F0562_017355 [Nyssa sinensis]|uniref:Myb/SANT-like domain-containing protein n=1 Tax=Nyssa sinensis TaxID=561372 RepID=A0A5J4ZHU9_9ASTE|nr:hypothetical protein F0562_017355 [Nyssa sinensis]
MVTADDCMWDDYIKAHPDMQTYRTKVVPYYDELCIICGHAVADGRYSLSCFDVDYDNEAKMLDDQNPPRDDRTKIDWSQTMDEHLIQLMLDQVHKGNKVGRTFKKKAWIHMITEFNTKFGFQYGKVILKNRYNVLRRQYNTIEVLLGQKGFSWDETQQMVKADDRVWNSVLKVRRNFRRYRNKTIPYYADMCIISKSIIGVAMPIVNTTKTDEAREERADRGGDRNSSDQQKRRQPEMEQNFQLSKKAQRVDEGMADVLREMAAAVTTLTKKDDNSISTKNVIDTLQAIPDIDEDLLLDACDFLEDEKRARMFLALDGAATKYKIIGSSMFPMEVFVSCDDIYWGQLLKHSPQDLSWLSDMSIFHEPSSCLWDVLMTTKWTVFLSSSSKMSLGMKVLGIRSNITYVINSAQANATHNHGLDPDRLLLGIL